MRTIDPPIERAIFPESDKSIFIKIKKKNDDFDSHFYVGRGSQIDSIFVKTTFKNGYNGP